jgi:3-hydroxyisobutyrate dehydrogenase
MRAGFIGLGSQGAPMAQRIVDAGFPLSLWARRPETLEAFADAAAAAFATPADLAAASDVIGICVVSDKDVEDVVLRDDGVLAGSAPGTVIAIHSTVHPETCRRIADRAAARDVELVDAPVSGGGIAAADGKLLVTVGGDAEVVERVRPVFATYGDPIIHLGNVGSGQMAKVLNNFLFTAQLTVAVETFDFAARLGVDRAALGQVLATGSGGSFATNVVVGSHFDVSGLQQVAASLLAKDAGIMGDLAERAGAAEPEHVAALARATLRMFAVGE